MLKKLFSLLEVLGFTKPAPTPRPKPLSYEQSIAKEIDKESSWDDNNVIK